MNVLYDISVLGLGQSNPLARTGVARAVENIACGLASSLNCKLAFCDGLFSMFSQRSGFAKASEIFYASLDYCNSHAQFSDTPLMHSSFFLRFGKKLIEMQSMLEAYKAVHNISPEFDPAVLSGLEESLQKFIDSLDRIPYAISSKRLQSFDIFHATFYPIPLQARQVQKVVKFLTVYDLIPILYPKWCGGWEEQRNTETLDSLVPEEDWVLAISQATKNDLCNYFGDRLDPDRVIVTHLAADPVRFYPCSDPVLLEQTRQKYKIPSGSYILGLSTLEPRKNLDRLIRCFAQVSLQQNIRDISLVLVGNPGWKFSRILDEVSRYQLSLKDRIVLTGRVDDADLPVLYSGAMAFAYPSLYEGFGLPPLEAMHCGTPVITSNTSSLPEVVGDAAMMVDPEDDDALCDAIYQIYTREDLRHHLAIKALQRSKHFSWKRCVHETIAAYKLALNHTYE